MPVGLGPSTTCQAFIGSTTSQENGPALDPSVALSSVEKRTLRCSVSVERIANPSTVSLGG